MVEGGAEGAVNRTDVESVERSKNGPSNPSRPHPLGRCRDDYLAVEVMQR